MNPNPNSLPTKATLLCASSLTVMAGATIAPSLPAMQDHFAGTPNAELLVKLVLTLPALFIVIGSPIAGLIVDRFGRKSLLLVAVIVYGFAGGSGFLLNSLATILAGRALLGFAVAGVMVSATTLIADYYIGAARAVFMGLQAASMGLGGVIFLFAGGNLAGINWRYPFLIYLFAWLLVPLIILSIKEPRSQDNQSLRQKSNNVSVSVNLLILIFGITTLSQIVFYMIPVQLPFYLRSLVNATPAQSGMAIASCTLFSSIASLSYGKVRAKFDFVSILPIMFGFMGIGYAIIGLVNNYALVLVGLAIAGLGLGLLMPNMSVWLSAAVPDAVRGRALGGLSTSLFLGQFLSPIVSQPLSAKVGNGLTYSLAGALLLILAVAFTIMKKQLSAFTATVAKVQ